MKDQLIVKGARQHNLKNIDISLPRDKFIVLTGLSGSGKSSLAFDTIYAEGQRRYVESLSAYARQFLGQMDKPDVDYIEGLSPAISIDQKTTSRNPRSTVGTVTEIYDYLRLLFARVGHAHCPECGKPITQQTIQQMTDDVMSFPEGIVIVQEVDGPEHMYSQNFACPDCHISLPKIEPRMFSFNSPFGACPACLGIGSTMEVDENRVIPDGSISFADGCVQALSSNPNAWFMRQLEGLLKANGYSLESTYDELPKALQKKVLTIKEALDFFSHLQLTDREQVIGAQILKEINARLGFLNNVGLDYLTMNRSAGTLSGGEAQRIRLATQIGSGLVGVLYILDEPSIGLHQRDNDRLINTLKGLRDLGNTLLVVEHDEDTMRAADYLVDIGPGAGEHGGQVVAAGTVDEVMQVKDSITGQYLSGRKFIALPDERRKPGKNCIEIRGAKENNLQNINVKFPIGLFTVVTGVSGSGKSTLINEILYKGLANQLYRSYHKVGAHKEIRGLKGVLVSM